MHQASSICCLDTLSLPTDHALPTPALQAKSYGDAELLDRLESKARIITLQQRLADSLAAVGELGEWSSCGVCSRPRAAAAASTPPAFRVQPPSPLVPSSPSLAAAAATDEASKEEAEAAASELRAAPKPLEALYNDYAIPSQVSSAAQGRQGPSASPCQSVGLLA